MMTRLYELAYEIDGDRIDLEQDGSCGGVNRITLHRLHVELIAGELGIPVLSGSAAELARRLRALRDRIVDLVDDRVFRDDLTERCGDALRYLTALDALADLSAQFCADLGPCEPDLPGDRANVTDIPVTDCSAISVTPVSVTSTSRRGRPPTGNAMTPAERQAKRRARQAELTLLGGET